MKLLLGKHELAYVNMHDVIKLCSIEYLTTQTELVWCQLSRPGPFTKL